MTIYLNGKNAILFTTKILKKIGWVSDSKGVLIKPRSDKSITVQEWKKRMDDLKYQDYHDNILSKN